MTDKIDTAKLNQKLAEWVGFYYDHNTTTGLVMEIGWRNPDGKVLNSKHIDGLPHFTSSFDAIFHWLVPKLKSIGFMARVQYSPLRDNDTGKLICDWTGYASCYDVSGKRGLNHFEEWAIAETPALALCLAIEKVIDNDKEVTK